MSRLNRWKILSIGGDLLFEEAMGHRSMILSHLLERARSV